MLPSREPQRLIARPGVFTTVGLWLGTSFVLTGCSLGLPAADAFFETDGSSREPADSGSGDADGAATDGSNEGEADAGMDGGADGSSGPDLDGAIGADGSQDAAPSVFDPEDGLVLYYAFNETEGDAVHDFAGNAHGIVVGTPTDHEQWVSAGRVNGALSLAGVDAPDGGTGHYVEMPQGVLLGLEECSIAVWINRTDGPMWQRVFDFGSGEPVWLYFTPYGGTGLPVVAGRTPALIFVDFVAIPDAPDGEGELQITKPIPVSTWVHFVLTWSADRIAVYLDGELVEETVTHGGVTPTDLGNTGQNYLGRSQFVADPYFDGMIDEFRVYDRVLTASDVAQLHALE